MGSYESRTTFPFHLSCERHRKLLLTITGATPWQGIAGLYFVEAAKVRRGGPPPEVAPDRAKPFGTG